MQQEQNQNAVYDVHDDVREMIDERVLTAQGGIHHQRDCQERPVVYIDTLLRMGWIVENLMPKRVDDRRRLLQILDILYDEVRVVEAGKLIPQARQKENTVEGDNDAN